MKNSLRKQSGQSIIIVALGFVALVALLAVVVDGANIYSQRRKVQNAVDSASYAGAQTLALPDPATKSRATNGAIRLTVKSFLEKNGINTTTNPYHVYYVTQNAGGSPVVEPGEIDGGSYGGSGGMAPSAISSRPVIGIQVSADKQFASFFAGVVGWQAFTVGSMGSITRGSPPVVIPPANGTPPLTSNGTCCADNLFPAAYSVTNFSDENGDGIRDVHFEESDPTYTYVIWDKGQQTGNGNWGYVHWNAPNDGSDATTLAGNMNDTTHSDRWYKGDWLGASTGNMGTTSVKDAWVARNGDSIIIPLYNATNGQTGANLQYQIEAFARFKVTGICRYGASTGTCPVTITQSSYRYISGKFQQWVFSQCAGSCPNYGIGPSKEPPPPDQHRSLIGVVKINKLTPAPAPGISTPVDVVHLLDISGSMDFTFGSPAQNKLTAAKNAMIAFNNVVSPTLGDRVGLATFPKATSGSSYNYSCTQNGSWSTYLWGENRLNLTSNIKGTSGVNDKINSLSAGNGTPLAGGLFVARQMVLDPAYHTSGHLPVLIVASDGIANILLNGQWTGFQGNTYNDVACNRQAVQDAINQANIAKSDLNGDGKPDVTIFSIAIGTDFNTVSLQAIASEPTASHFIQATDATTMQNIYTSIASQAGNPVCPVNQDEVFAPNANVSIRNTTTGTVYQATTTSTGYFSFDDIAAGTYEFTVGVTVDGLNYNVYTDGYAGPVLASHPTVTVSNFPGPYEQNIFLKTNDPVCP